MLTNGPYHYRPGPDTLGIGIDNLALERFGIPINSPVYGPRYNVRRSIAPLLGANSVAVYQSLPSNGIRGNGVYLSGQLALEALSDFNKNNKID